MAIRVYFDKILGTFREGDSIYTERALSIKGTTNDGSTNILEVLDSDGNIVDKVNTDGFYQIRYRDEYVAGEWILASGVAAPDIIDATIGGISTRLYSFDGNATTEWLTNLFEINHDVAISELNTDTVKIEFHVHFMPSTTATGNVEWRFEYCYIPYNGIAISQTTQIASFNITSNSINKHLIAGIELPKPVGGFNIGDVILFNLKRIPTGTDTYPNDAILLKCALHVPIDGNGSRQRYIK